MKVCISLPLRESLSDNPSTVSRLVDYLEARGFDCSPLIVSSDLDRWVHLVRSNGLSSSSVELVSNQIAELKTSDLLLAFLPECDLSVAFHMSSASRYHKQVITVTAGQMLHHPWIWYLSDHVIWTESPYTDGLYRAVDQLYAIRESHPPRPSLLLLGSPDGGWREYLTSVFQDQYDVLDPTRADESSGSLHPTVHDLERSRYVVVYLSHLSDLDSNVLLPLGYVAGFWNRPKILVVAEPHVRGHRSLRWIDEVVLPNRWFDRLEDLVSYLQQSHHVTVQPSQ